LTKKKKKTLEKNHDYKSSQKILNLIFNVFKKMRESDLEREREREVSGRDFTSNSHVGAPVCRQ